MTTLCWPFSTKDSAQFRRIDQGWDLQAGVGTAIVAVADGIIEYAHDIQWDGSNASFGNPYPVLHLNVPDSHGLAIYYGHAYPETGDGVNVKQGDVIGHSQPHSGGSAYPYSGWLEIGWWNSGPTGNGQAMYDSLINAPVFSLPPLPEEDDMALVIATDTDHSMLQICVLGDSVPPQRIDPEDAQGLAAAGVKTAKVSPAMFDRVNARAEG